MPVTLERLFSVRGNADLPILGSTPLKLLQACSASIRNALGLIWGGGGGGGVAPVAATAPELGQAQDQEWETQQEMVDELMGEAKMDLMWSSCRQSHHRDELHDGIPLLQSRYDLDSGDLDSEDSDNDVVDPLPVSVKSHKLGVQFEERVRKKAWGMVRLSTKERQLTSQAEVPSGNSDEAKDLEADATLKDESAAKQDDAEVNKELWNAYMWEELDIEEGHREAYRGVLAIAWKHLKAKWTA